VTTKDEANAKSIAALLRERDALVSRGLDERVAQVDAELKNRGHKVDVESKESVKRVENPQRQPPQGRSTTPKQQAKD
jgi:hypothetical protein